MGEEEIDKSNWVLDRKSLIAAPIDTDVKRYADFLKSIEFTGDLQRGGVLLSNYAAGLRTISTTLMDIGLKIQQPQMVIHTGDTGMIPVVATEELFIINKRFLEQLVTMEFSKPGSITYNGVKCFEGTVEDWAFCTGVEDGHHSAFMQLQKPVERTKFVLPYTEYRALDGEYEALKWQLHIAKEKGLSQDTIQFLEQTLKDARAIRKLKGKRT